MSRDGAVLHYVQRWLPASEPFVYDVVTKTRRPAVVVSREPKENVDRFPHRPVATLDPLLRLTPRPLERRVITAALLAVARRRKVELVHVHFGYRLADVTGLVRRGLPLVVSLHGHDITAHAREYPELYPPLLPSAAAVIVPSEFLAAHAIAHGARPETIHRIPAGVDTTFFRPSPLPENSYEVVFVGRFVDKKGVDVLAEAWPKVRKAVPKARLFALGYGPLEPVVARVGKVVPRPNRALVRDHLRRARVLVSPSRTPASGDAESLLIVNLEAQATGRPVVTTRHGGIPEFVSEGETALLVEEGDPEALAEALVRVLTDDGLAARLAAAGPAWAARFDVAQCVAAVDDLYDDVVGASRGAPAT